MNGLVERLWSWGVFKVGQTRRISSFPWVTWDISEHAIDYPEIMSALPLLEAGDIGLHRDAGYLSNYAIPGFMKHAWIHTIGATGNDITQMRIVEATHDGVLKKHPIRPMHSDYVIIVRPLSVTRDDVYQAIRKADMIVGHKYDVHFEFDIEKELAELDAEGKFHLRSNLGKFDAAFSCTETVAFSWWHKREQLRLYRKLHRGKDVIVADDYVNGGFSVVWASKNVTLDTAKKLGLSEEGLHLLEEYFGNNKNLPSA